MKTSPFLVATLTGTLALVSGVSARAQAPAPAAPAAPVVANRADALLKLDTEVSKLCATEGAEKAFETYLAPDAVSPLAEIDQPVDRAGFLKRIQRADSSESTLKWTPIRADLAASGDMGYTYGKWSLTQRVGGGIVIHGYYTSVWKKSADGAWKIVFTMGNETPI